MTQKYLPHQSQVRCVRAQRSTQTRVSFFFVLWLSCTCGERGICRPHVSKRHTAGRFVLKCRNKSTFTFSVICKRRRSPRRGQTVNFADFPASTPAAVTAKVTKLRRFQRLVKCCTCKKKKKSNMFQNCQVFLSRRTLQFYRHTQPVGMSDVTAVKIMQTDEVHLHRSVTLTHRSRTKEKRSSVKQVQEHMMKAKTNERH